jgi:hypothetical protein
VQLLIGQTRGGGANTRLTLEQLDFLDLTLCFGFCARREILSEALPVYAGVDLENNSPGGVREFRYDERI